MIEISDKIARDAQQLFDYFITATANMPRCNKLDNARRVAGNIIKYINKKKYDERIKRPHTGGAY